MRKLATFIGLALAGLLLSGCMYKVSDRVPKDGIMTQDEVKFPKADSTWSDDGRYPSIDDLRKVQVGMNKDEIRGLLGHPHFAEGLYAVVEWDYLFNLKQSADEQDVFCQFKVVYDSNYTARSFFWQPQSCADIVGGATQLAVVQESSRYEFSTDMLFDFASAKLSLDGKAQIAKLVKAIEMSDVADIKIVGYTDPIGSQKVNLELSKKRANSVKNEFIAGGIPAQAISADGLGESVQMVLCEDMPRKELIKCLAPNRRANVTLIEQ
ncbi:OmpA family protein [Campylobacter geochelonis]|uniref:OmpA family protein n=1 Tax=Campylobacter geochelonis TaxID=1780362 RepID=UPI000770878B|nr:OmpA family protein [Campylobacter geochelonis]CZE48866.1 Plp4 [Campylobacter geochelonis]